MEYNEYCTEAFFILTKSKVHLQQRNQFFFLKESQELYPQK